MSKEIRMRFTLKELKQMIELAEDNNTTIVDVGYTPGSISSLVRAKPVVKDAEFVDITDYDSW